MNADKSLKSQPNYLPTYNLNHRFLLKWVPEYLSRYVPNCMPNHLPNQFSRDAFRNLQSKHRGLQKHKHFQEQAHKSKPRNQNKTNKTWVCNEVWTCPTPASTVQQAWSMLWCIIAYVYQGLAEARSSDKALQQKSLPSVTPSHISDKALQQKVFQALQQKSLPSIAAKSLPSNPRAKILPIHTNTMQSNLIHSNQIKSEVGGENGSEAGVPNRESKPSAHAPAPHARHDRSMARSVLVARPIFEKSITLLGPPRVQRPIVPTMLWASFLSHV